MSADGVYGVPRSIRYQKRWERVGYLFHLSLLVLLFISSMACPGDRNRRSIFFFSLVFLDLGKLIWGGKTGCM